MACAARHINGKAILYGDKISNSMRRPIPDPQSPVSSPLQGEG
jgi:excinuclease UvrABC helicase subunit UvrB